MDQKENTLVRQLSGKTALVYQKVGTEAVCEACAEYPTAYSVIVLLLEEGAVSGSRILYDVTREEARCMEIMRELCECEATPDNAARALEAAL